MSGERTWGIVPVAALLVIAGCDASPPDGSPSTAPGTTTTSAAPRPYGTPSVADPLKFERFYEDPCLGLTPGQRTALDLGEGAVKAAGNAPCGFIVKGSDNKLTVEIRFVKGRGLVDAYEANAAGRFDRWEPARIDGYPAVKHDGQWTDCYVTVGLSDSATFFVWYLDRDLRAGVDTCGPATRIATEVLATVRAAQ